MSDPRRFDGCVHDEVTLEVGQNRDGERVVRIDLNYKRPFRPVTTTMILARDAASALRDQLDRLLA